MSQKKVKRGLGQAGNYETNGLSLQSLSEEMGQPVRRKTIPAAVCQCGLWHSEQMEPLLSQRQMTAKLQCAKLHLNDSEHKENVSVV